jgi:hypothetical protein
MEPMADWTALEAESMYDFEALSLLSDMLLMLVRLMLGSLSYVLEYMERLDM